MNIVKHFKEVYKFYDTNTDTLHITSSLPVLADDLGIKVRNLRALVYGDVVSSKGLVVYKEPEQTEEIENA